jgi:hypothetical protein
MVCARKVVDPKNTDPITVDSFWATFNSLIEAWTGRESDAKKYASDIEAIRRELNAAEQRKGADVATITSLNKEIGDIRDRYDRSITTDHEQLKLSETVVEELHQKLNLFTAIRSLLVKAHEHLASEVTCTRILEMEDTFLSESKTETSQKYKEVQDAYHTIANLIEIFRRKIGKDADLLLAKNQEVDMLRSETQSWNVRIQTFEAQLGEKGLEISTLNAQLAAALAAAGALQSKNGSQLKQYADRVKELDDELKTKADLAKAAQALSDNLRKKLKECTSNHTDEIKEAKRKLSVQKVQLEEAEHKIADIKGQLDDKAKELEKFRPLEGQLQLSNDKIRELKELLAETKGRLQSASNESKEELYKSQEKIKGLNSEILTKDAKLERANKMAKMAEEELESFKSEAEEAGKALRTALEKAKERASKAEEELQSFKAKTKQSERDLDSQKRPTGLRFEEYAALPSIQVAPRSKEPSINPVLKHWLAYKKKEVPGADQIGATATVAQQSTPAVQAPMAKGEAAKPAPAVPTTIETCATTAGKPLVSGATSAAPELGSIPPKELSTHQVPAITPQLPGAGETDTPKDIRASTKDSVSPTDQPTITQDTKEAPKNAPQAVNPPFKAPKSKETPITGESGTVGNGSTLAPEPSLKEEDAQKAELNRKNDIQDTPQSQNKPSAVETPATTVEVSVIKDGEMSANESISSMDAKEKEKPNPIEPPKKGSTTQLFTMPVHVVKASAIATEERTDADGPVFGRATDRPVAKGTKSCSRCSRQIDADEFEDHKQQCQMSAVTKCQYCQELVSAAEMSSHSLGCKAKNSQLPIDDQGLVECTFCGNRFAPMQLSIHKPGCQARDRKQSVCNCGYSIGRGHQVDHNVSLHASFCSALRNSNRKIQCKYCNQLFFDCHWFRSSHAPRCKQKKASQNAKKTAAVQTTTQSLSPSSVSSAAHATADTQVS